MENNVLTPVALKCLKKCLAATAAMDADTRGRIHVNLFPATILDTPTDRLLALFAARADPSEFCVEISEQQFLGDPAYLKLYVDELKAAGVHVAIDDVGFGRSSLETLIVLEPDVVKIDRSYVHGAADNPSKRQCLERLIQVAQHLSTELVAEGVETEAEQEMIRSLGVRYAQGYLWGRPQPVPLQ